MIPRTTLRMLGEHSCRQQALVGLGLLCSLAAAPAQVVLDGKFGTSGALTGPNYNITAVRRD